MSDGGKGSSPRPYSVDQETFASNWDRIFGKKKEQDEVKNEIPQGQDTTDKKMKFLYSAQI